VNPKSAPCAGLARTVHQDLLDDAPDESPAGILAASPLLVAVVAGACGNAGHGNGVGAHHGRDGPLLEVTNPMSTSVIQMYKFAGDQTQYDNVKKGISSWITAE
jgi:hypothetical protein